MPKPGAKPIDDQQRSKLDILLWFVVLIMVGVGVWGNFYFREQAWALRAAGEVVLAIIAITIAGQTAKGRTAWAFMKEARTELRRVVWPTRPETVQTTAMIIAMVVLTALILWGLDSIILWLVGMIAGQ